MDIKVDLIDFIDQYRRKIITRSQLDYKKQFIQSFKNSTSLDLPVPSFTIHRENMVSCSRISEIRDVIHYAVYNSPFMPVAFNCFSSTLQAKLALKEELNIDSVITLGSLSNNKKGHRFFYESLTKLKYRAKNPHYRTEKINLHCWLTLEDFYIIDVSLLSSLKLFGEHTDLDSRQFYHMDGLSQHRYDNQYRYHPLLVGDGFFKILNPTYEPLESSLSA